MLILLFHVRMIATINAREERIRANHGRLYRIMQIAGELVSFTAVLMAYTPPQLTSAAPTETLHSLWQSKYLYLDLSDKQMITTDVTRFTHFRKSRNYKYRKYI